MAYYKKMHPNIKSKKINGITYVNPNYDQSYLEIIDLMVDKSVDSIFLFFSFFSKEGLSGVFSASGKLLLYAFYFIVFNISIGIVFLIAALAFHYFV